MTVNPRAAEWQREMRTELATILHRVTSWQVSVPDNPDLPYVWIINEYEVGFRLTVECLAIEVPPDV